jgi:hypothetical protein
MNVVLVLVGVAITLIVYINSESLKRLLAKLVLERSYDYQEKQMGDFDEETEKVETSIEKAREEFSELGPHFHRTEGKLREYGKAKGYKVDGIESVEALKQALGEQTVADKKVSTFVHSNRVSRLAMLVDAPFYNLFTIPDVGNETLDQMLGSLSEETLSEINQCMYLRNLVINHALQRMKRLLKVNAHSAKVIRFPSLLSEEIISEGQYIEKSKQQWDRTYLKVLQEYEGFIEQHQESYQKLRLTWGALEFKK